MSSQLQVSISSLILPHNSSYVVHVLTKGQILTRNGSGLYA